MEDNDSPTRALTYKTLYTKVNELYVDKPSRRDFQAALDQLERNHSLVIEKDPSDRRKVRIWRGEGAPVGSEQILVAVRVALVDFFRKNPESAPLYVRASGAITIRGIEEKDVKRELTRIHRCTTPLEKAFGEILEAERKLGKKPSEAVVRKWLDQYNRVADAVAEATAIESSDALKAKREIDTKKIVDRVTETLGKRETESRRLIPA